MVPIKADIGLFALNSTLYFCTVCSKLAGWSSATLKKKSRAGETARDGNKKIFIDHE
jgi:hypothetical protein